MQIFNYDPMDAMKLTETIDSTGKGRAIGGITKELAFHLRDLVIVEAQTSGYPLKVEAQLE